MARNVATHHGGPSPARRTWRNTYPLRGKTTYSNRTNALATDGRNRHFELVAMPHLDAAFNLARWLTGNTADAEDVVQDAYLRAYRYLDAFRGDNFRVWLLTIVR